MAEEPSRRIGRPDQQAADALLRHIMVTATRLFTDQGYAATSIEQIAAAAGAGKQTIYRHFVSKERLFQAMIEMRIAQLEALVRAAEQSRQDPLAALREACRDMLEFVLQPDAVAFYRVLIAESVRFPDLAATVVRHSRLRFGVAMQRLIEAAQEAGQLRPAESAQLQDLLYGLVVGWPLHQALLGRAPLSEDADRSRHLAAAWALFLHGAGRQAGPDQPAARAEAGASPEAKPRTSAPSPAS